MAQRIVDWRASRGPFRTLADLDSVPGVGPALLRDAGPHLALAPAPSTGNREQGTGNSGQHPVRGRGSTRDPSQTTASVADWDRSRKPSAAPAGAPSAPVELNQATPEELATLPGIGPALARRIVEWRGANGPFRAVDDLEKVPGIGPAKLERLRPLVRATP
ncbi:MAG: helix-hairpin-helix domain-containing protein [Gemmatimonadetes bacterium]|nr:helix-hairpin-helix domain-containing protein [Gemmatimonadota bacterium]